MQTNILSRLELEQRVNISPSLKPRAKLIMSTVLHSPMKMANIIRAVTTDQEYPDISYLIIQEAESITCHDQ